VPRLTQWYLRSALIYLVLSLTIGLVLAANSMLGISPSLASLQPVFFHLFVVGWLTQLIFGVAYWMFPKYSRETPYRSVNLSRATFWLLNTGLLLRALSEPLFQPGSTPFLGYLLILSAGMQWIAGLFFAINTWGRVKTR
jgi:hypothetical protein